MATSIETLQTFETYQTYDVVCFGDSVITTVTHNPSKVSKWISDMKYIYGADPDDLLVFGLDIEWRPNFTPNSQNPVATLQICINERCLVFQLIHARYIPDSLLDFLSDDGNTFVGVGVKSDLEKLERDYGFGSSVRAVDLGRVAADCYGRKEMKTLGLKDLARAVLGKEMEKPHRVTMSAWDDRRLTSDQEEFPITIGNHQGSALSSFLFAIVMDELTRGIQTDVPWCMMFADDIVLIEETKVGVQQKLELWRDTLEARGFRLSRSKTEYMECRFSDNSDREAGMITFDGKVVHGSTFFLYLGSIIQKDGELDGDVAHRIKAGWLKWKSATGVLCDPGMPHRLKGKFYRTAIRPTLLYGTECWAVKQCHVQKMNVAEMRMRRWMCGHTKKDRLRNEVIRENVRVASIEDKMMENRLRWFGHVRRRPVDAPVRRLESWIENYMRFLGIGKSVAMERQIWRERIRVVDES
ncbi:hypothetical protein OROHE_027152 [Orobanche hederae]